MNILKSIFVISFLICSAFSSIISPTNILQTSGGVTDIVIESNKLYVATKASKVDIFDLKNQKLNKTITLEKVKDFVGDTIDSKVYSVDILNNKVLILSQGENGGRKIDIYENDTLTNVISDQKRLFIAKAKFIDDEKIVFLLLSNQLYLYDLKKNKNIYIKQISKSKFSDFVLSENKKKIIIADESGDLKLYDTIKGELLRLFEGQNLDNVFKVDYKNGVILTAGQDRRAVVYSDLITTYFKTSDFLIYSCGLSPSATKGAYAVNENNDVSVFDTKTKRDLFTLTGNKMTLNNILFINENEVLVSSDDNSINYYKLNKTGE